MAEPGPLILGDCAATEDFGRRLAGAALALRPARLMVYLQGDLGAGKTTLARGFLAGLGHTGRVPSPTYTLVEPYRTAEYEVLHVDLYRLGSARDVADLGLADQLLDGTMALIEWPENGAGQVPPADVVLRLESCGHERALRPEWRTALGRAIGTRLGFG